MKENENLITEQAVKELTIIDELLFRPRQTEYKGGLPGSHSVRLDRDSYVWLFTGRRGGGKSVSMTYYIVRSIAIYNMPIIANYKLDFMMRRYRPDGSSYLQHIESETLDFEKLLTQDEVYRHVLIAIDECPDILSHLASMSWKNRLVNAFTRQIRHNFNTLFLAAQDDSLIDKSMRWQVDIETQCADVSRAMGDNAGLDRGEMLTLTFFDQSGQWTGKTTEDRMNTNKYKGRYSPLWVEKRDLFPRFMFGDESHKPVFDSWQDINILESLRKVDMKLDTIKIGNHDKSLDEKYPVSASALKRAATLIGNVLKDNAENPNIYQLGFFKALGGLTDTDKNNLGKVLSNFNVERGGGSGAQRWYGFASFDIEGFNEYVKTSEPDAGKS